MENEHYLGHSMIRQISFSYTLNCTGQCRMCVTDSYPGCRSKLSLDEVKRYIGQARAIPGLKVISFTGGEVFLYEKEILEAVAYAARLGFCPKVVTNASWATSRAKASRKLKEFIEAGLQEIWISADDYHQEFIPGDRVACALWAADRHKIFRTLVRVTDKNTVQTDQEFIERFGIQEKDCISVNDHYRYDEWMELQIQNLEGRSINKEKLFILKTQLVPGGRGRQLRDQCVLIPFEQLPPGGCLEIGQRLNVSANAELFPCCSPIAHYPFFSLGSLRRSPLDELLEKMGKNLLVDFLQVQGPSRLMEYLKEKGMNFPGSFSSLCHLCAETIHEAHLKSIEKVIEERFFETQMIRSRMESRDDHALPKRSSSESG